MQNFAENCYINTIIRLYYKFTRTNNYNVISFQTAAGKKVVGGCSMWNSELPIIHRVTSLVTAAGIQLDMFISPDDLAWHFVIKFNNTYLSRVRLTFVQRYL